MVVNYKNCMSSPLGCYTLDGVVYDSATNRPVQRTAFAKSPTAKATPAKSIKPIPSPTAPVGSRELGAAIYADFGQAACAEALAKGLTYVEVAQKRVAELQGEQRRLQAELDRRERPRGIRFANNGFKVSLGSKPPAA